MSSPSRMLLALATALNERAKFETVFMISALTGDGVADVRTWLAEQVPARAVALSGGSDFRRADASARR